MMNYQNPFINPYGAVPQYPPVMPAASQQVTRVNGENGARAYQIGPNSSAMLLDESGLMVWLVTSDGAGYKTAQTQKILDAIMGNRMADMQSQINALQLQAATSNVLRFPSSWTFAGGVFPPATATA